jgi:putative ABC transport system permease protein
MVILMRIFAKKRNEIPFGRPLVVLQYIVTFILINVTIYLRQQVDFMLNKDLGYTKDHVLFIKRYEMGSGLNSLSISHLNAFENEVMKHKDIVNVGLSSITPGCYHHSNQNIWVNAGEKINSNTIYIDRNYVGVYGLKLLAGRNLTEQDGDKVLINKALMHALGYKDPQQVVNQAIYIDDAISHHVAPGKKIVAGVLDDYFQEPLNKVVAPAKYHYSEISKGRFSVRFRGENHEEVVAYVRKVFNKFYPGDAFNYAFLDGFLMSQYEADIQFKELITLTSFLSLLLASLAILGLILYSVEVSKKSIAIRKVLGSSNLSIYMLFLKNYLINFALAIAVAIPLTYFLVKEMLSDYAYRIEINGFYTLVPALLILGLIFLIIGIQVSIRTKQDPIRALRQQ